jgi:type IV secretory pathway protease TraF
MRRWIRYLLWSTLSAIGVLALVHFIWLDVWIVPASPQTAAASLAPALRAGDVVLVARRAQVGAERLVRCLDPDSPAAYVAGRVQGVAGERVAVVQSRVRVNGVERAYRTGCDAAEAPPNPRRAGDAQCEVVASAHPYAVWHSRGTNQVDAHAGVEPGKVYLVSDNVSEHADSRDFGQLPVASCAVIAFRIVSAQGFSDVAHRMSVIY